MKGYDWLTWKKRYIESSLGIRQIAKLDGAPSVSALSKKCKEEKWPEQREAFQREAEKKAARQATKKLALDFEQEYKNIYDLGKFLVATGVKALKSKTPEELSAVDGLRCISTGADLLKGLMVDLGPQTDAGDERVVIVLPAKQSG